MSAAEQLKLRALRILHDGLEHSDAAICWALAQVHKGPDRLAELLAEMDQPPFTLRELSLGAARW